MRRPPPRESMIRQFVLRGPSVILLQAWPFAPRHGVDKRSDDIVTRPADMPNETGAGRRSMVPLAPSMLPTPVALTANVGVVVGHRPADHSTSPALEGGRWTCS